MDRRVLPLKRRRHPCQRERSSWELVNPSLKPKRLASAQKCTLSGFGTLRLAHKVLARGPPRWQAPQPAGSAECPVAEREKSPSRYFAPTARSDEGFRHQCEMQATVARPALVLSSFPGTPTEEILWACSQWRRRL